ncbi:MAG TPA: response regulator transcription factor [Chitinophagaceae bacterium]|jgi:DNA-binding NarL/FixJ family response regulator|nr:response regulator transcription factor [Chitinophagaceae bacterium]
MAKITILIADDHKLIRETWTYILNSDDRFEVVAECGDAEQAVELAKELAPNIILMDINMPPFNGFEATEQIRKVSPESKIIGVSMHSQPAYAKKMLQVGARGYVTKNSSKEEMFNAITEVYNGNKYVCDEIKTIISDQLLDDNNDTPSINSLTEREMQIIHHIREGHSSKEIATQLDISLKTVEVHRHNILKKLKLKNSASLVNFINSSAGYV